MYCAICAQIIFAATDTRPQIEIRRVGSCKIESSWSSLTDTAEITLPRNVPDFSNGVRNLIHRGDPVTINFGYNGDLVEEFTGYVVEVSSTIPITIRCEDEMFMLKKIKVNKSYANVNLKTLISDIVPGYIVDVADITLGAVRLEKTTAAMTLQLLRDKQIQSYFKGKTLVVGKIYTDDSNIPLVKFAFNRNIISNSNLKFTRAEDMDLRVTAVSYLPGGKTLKFSVGDETGTESEIAHWNITDINKLKELAQQDYDKMNVDGYTGSFTAWAIPVIRHGQKAELTNDLSPDENGTFYCDKTVLTLSDSPYLHREITIGRRVS